MATRTITRYRNPPKKKARRKAKLTVPLAVVAGFAPLGFSVYNSFKTCGLDGASQALVAGTTGYSRWENQFKLEYLLQGAGPIVAGILAHKLAGAFGINRALGRAGVPFVRF